MNKIACSDVISRQSVMSIMFRAARKYLRLDGDVSLSVWRWREKQFNSPGFGCDISCQSCKYLRHDTQFGQSTLSTLAGSW